MKMYRHGPAIYYIGLNDVGNSYDIHFLSIRDFVIFHKQDLGDENFCNSQ